MSIVPVGVSLMKFRGGVNQWAWVIHRVAGFGVFAFLALHIVDIAVLAFGPKAFDSLLFLYKGPMARMLEVVLAFGLMYHSLNGVRLSLSGFIPTLAVLKTARRLFAVELGLFVCAFSPVGYLMVWSLDQQPYHHNPLIAVAIVLGMLFLPAAVILTGQKLASPRLPSRLRLEGNYTKALDALARGRPLPGSRREFAVWLFMRLTGITLIVLALFHLLWQHLHVTVERIDYSLVVQRWNDPANPGMSVFWRVYDLLLLVFALTHGTMGMNTIMKDYAHGRVVRSLLQAGLAALWAALLLAGAGIIFLFRGSIP